MRRFHGGREPIRRCVDETTEDGVTKREETQGDCVLSGDRVKCTYRYLAGDQPPSVGEERLDADGLWSIGIDVITWDPPGLVLPTDIAASKRWTTETTMVVYPGPNGSPQRLPVRRTNEVVASPRCEGGLLIKSERRVEVPNASRTVTERLMCPGLGMPREATSWTYKEGADTPFRTIVSTCRAE